MGKIYLNKNILDVIQSLYVRMPDGKQAIRALKRDTLIYLLSQQDIFTQRKFIYNDNQSVTCIITLSHLPTGEQMEIEGADELKAKAEAEAYESIGFRIIFNGKDTELTHPSKIEKLGQMVSDVTDHFRPGRQSCKGKGRVKNGQGI